MEVEGNARERHEGEKGMEAEGYFHGYAKLWIRLVFVTV